MSGTGVRISAAEDPASTLRSRGCGASSPRRWARWGPCPALCLQPQVRVCTELVKALPACPPKASRPCCLPPTCGPTPTPFCGGDAGHRHLETTNFNVHNVGTEEEAFCGASTSRPSSPRTGLKCTKELHPADSTQVLHYRCVCPGPARGRQGQGLLSCCCLPAALLCAAGVSRGALGMLLWPAALLLKPWALACAASLPHAARSICWPAAGPLLARCWPRPSPRTPPQHTFPHTHAQILLRHLPGHLPSQHRARAHPCQRAPGPDRHAGHLL
jgi:hypothetical protein